MDQPSALDAPQRRARIAPLAIAVLLAFVIGVGLMWFAMREGGRFLPSDAVPADAPSPAAAPAPATVIAPAPPPTIGAPAPAMGASDDPATLATRAAALAAQLAALEARTASVAGDATRAAEQAARAEAILVAFAARRAIDRGVGLGYVEEQLRLRFARAQPQATFAVIDAARSPVTIEALRQGLDANTQVLLTGASDGWVAGLMQELRSLVILHDGSVPSPLPADRLTRARRLLDAGQVEAALAEVGRLPGAAQAANWTAAAQRYIEARRALDTLEAAAITGAVQAVPPAAAPPVMPEPAPAGDPLN